MKFKIILDDTEFNKSFLNSFNRKHATDFAILDFDYDEVTFATIETKKCGNEEILKLGIALAQYSNLNRILN